MGSTRAGRLAWVSGQPVLAKKHLDVGRNHPRYVLLLEMAPYVAAFGIGRGAYPGLSGLQPRAIAA